VTDYGAGLLIQSEEHWNLREYPNYPGVLSGESSAVHDVDSPVSRMTVRGGTLYIASHSTDTIERFDLATGEFLSPIILEDFDGWIRGMSATVDGQLVVSGDSGGDTIQIFDADTGAELRTVHPEVDVSGLSCVTRK
jgi:WD40 repeat protein